MKNVNWNHGLFRVWFVASVFWAVTTVHSWYGHHFCGGGWPIPSNFWSLLDGGAEAEFYGSLMQMLKTMVGFPATTAIVWCALRWVARGFRQGSAQPA